MWYEIFINKKILPDWVIRNILRAKLQNYANAISSMSPSELDGKRKEFVEKVIGIGKDKISVIVGISHQEPNRSRAFLEHAIDSGADGVLCAVPMDIIENRWAVKRYFSNVVKSEPPMLMIQDLHWSGFGMSIDTIKDLWQEVDSFRCLKLETVPAVNVCFT